eukprot:TRINITY_DN33342_c0_g1_i1.p2 TRINITY_DN33342_c0_g1~~TRINITY_DN33342_c0_g1_i1.p2  ORF type:complete len:119 (+),score=10.13 TRINITY_DN33342_c0_g1_i1:33-359(+)
MNQQIIIKKDFVFNRFFFVFQFDKGDLKTYCALNLLLLFLSRFFQHVDFYLNLSKVQFEKLPILVVKNSIQIGHLAICYLLIFCCDIFVEGSFLLFVEGKIIVKLFVK